MEKWHYGAIVLAVLLLASISTVYAANPPGATVTTATRSSRTDPSSSGVGNVTAGSTQEANVSAVANTYRWAGFYGEVTGSITLADASNNWFYNWTVSDPTGSNVYAFNDSATPVWSSVVAANEGNISATYSWLATGNPDSWDTTFSGTMSLTVAGSSVSSVPYAVSLPTASGLASFSLYDGTNLFWAANVTSGATLYDGSTGDYQMLVPEDGTGGDTSTTLYDFYLELL